MGYKVNMHHIDFKARGNSLKIQLSMHRSEFLVANGWVAVKVEHTELWLWYKVLPADDGGRVRPKHITLPKHTAIDVEVALQQYQLKAMLQEEPE